MSCEQFRTAISEAAGQERSPEKAAAATAHLDECASCREWYASEQELFSAIDSELSRVVNAEASASFLPRVRAAVGRESVNHDAAHSWLVFWPATAVIVGIALFVIVLQRFQAQTQVAPRTTASASAKPSATSSATSSLTSETAVTKDSRQELPQQAIAEAGRKPRAVRRFTGNAEEHTGAAAKLEVLVPNDERLALARFIAELSQRHELEIALTKPAPAAPSVEVRSEPLQIAELKVAPLTPAEGQ